MEILNEEIYDENVPTDLIDSGSLLQNIPTEQTESKLLTECKSFNSTSSNVQINSRRLYKIENSGNGTTLQQNRYAIKISSVVEQNNKGIHKTNENFNLIYPEAKSLSILDFMLSKKNVDAIKEFVSICHGFFDYFGISKNDIICWEFGKMTATIPNYMIIRDPESNSIIISIRGTLNLADVITDVMTYYEPWRDGFVHRGMLRSAQYLVKNSLKDIRSAVKKFKVNSIQVIGHSLGASVSCLVTMLLRKRCKDLIAKGIDIHAWNFGTPPCSSLDLACKNETMSYIDNFVNENDIVPRLSYGSLIDFRELVKFVANKLKDDDYKKIPSKDKHSTLMASIDEYYKNLKSNSREQKLYIPGTVHYLYKKRNPSNPLLKEILCEKSTQESFIDITLRKNFLLHHLPEKYDKKLGKVIKRLAKNSKSD
ncbi:14150_t:CDS:2 [Racocetra fulgida]|uniref:sn-1-specific diacylglycerol lipase n=1 Tax=Racocetra fulgida TaxID=60492 RepID=A0A9N9ALN4_9GLOM|nr:14150_t:CDS:2 [Racocetra fulgida]